jgi:NAD(P)-dependent dehydrogenase (short-subunit alcohol dehydrogenase family)
LGDILINNAGILVNKPFLELSPDETMKMFSTNLMVPAKLIRQLYKHMGGATPTHVVNIGSMGAVQGSVKFPGLSLYSASKGALAVLTECLAVEFADKNIFVNYLAIGAVQTEMLSQAFPGYKAPVSAEEIADFIAEFARNGYRYFNGKILPVSLSTP